MQLTPLVLAATAAAFVVVPELSEADENIFKALPIYNEELPGAAGILTAAPLHSQSIAVPCRQCEGKDTSLQLQFEVVDGKRLLVNGFELYPEADPWHNDLMATMAGSDLEGAPRKLGYSLAVTPEAMDKDQHLQLLDVELRVIEVGEQFVDSVPVISIKLIKAGNDELAIAKVDATSDRLSGCSSMACRAKEMMDDAFAALKGMKPFKHFKGCGGRFRHKSRPNMGEKPKHHDHHGHGKGRPEHGRKMHHHHDGGLDRLEWRRLFTNVAAQVFLPIVMGITAGVGVALYVPLFISHALFVIHTDSCYRIAMAVCSLVVRLGSFIRGDKGERRRRRRQCRRAMRAHRAAQEENLASEKEALMEVAEDEQLPEYEGQVQL